MPDGIRTEPAIATVERASQWMRQRHEPRFPGFEPGERSDRYALVRKLKVGRPPAALRFHHVAVIAPGGMVVSAIEQCFRPVPGQPPGVARDVHGPRVERGAEEPDQPLTSLAVDDVGAVVGLAELELRPRHPREM